ncbi:MAG: nucleotidyltransferase domain-containing protein [Leptospiraceae bacterium]|nr:nucleotidyltransferase domain-containing protein [Leptospiraceae bacterium]
MKDLISQVINYLQSKDYIENAILFGSRANGKIHAMSDIDIGILTERELDLLEIGEIVGDLEIITNLKVDLLLLNNLYYSDPLLAFNIIQNHKELFLNDIEKWNEYRVKTLLVYFDEKPILDKVNLAFKKRYAKDKESNE